MDDIINSLEEEGMNQTYTENITAVEYLIVILTGGVMENPTCLENFKNILVTRKDLLDDKKVIFIMSKHDGWKFEPSATEKAAKNVTAKEVRKVINDGHEVMTYRPKGVKRDYEHDSMMVEMMKRLGLATVEEVATMNEQQNGVVVVVDTEEEEKVGVDDDERKED